MTTSAAAVSLTTGMEDPEKVTVAMLVAVAAAEAGRETLMFLTKEAVRLVLPGYAVGVACDGCPSLPSLVERYAAANGRFLVCPLCFNARRLDADRVSGNAALGGTVQLWEWIGDRAVTTFSY
jgi:predicted peroxiredoxin